MVAAATPSLPSVLAEDHAAQCMLGHAGPSEPTRVWRFQLAEAENLCRMHGWQGACEPPCTRIRLARTGQGGPPCNGMRPPHPAVSAGNTRALIERARAAAAGRGAGAATAAWRGKVLRARSFVHDGFWVRAHFVLMQGMFAALLRCSARQWDG